MTHETSIPRLTEVAWRKSSYSTNNGNCVELAHGSTWTKSSHSSNNGMCVELAHGPAWVAVRDSKNPDGPALVVEPAALRGLVRRLHG